MAPVYEPTSVGLRPQHDRDADDAEARPAARADVPHPREAVRRHQRLGQAQQLVDGHRRRARTSSTRATTRTPTPSSSRSCSRSSAACNVHADILRASHRGRRPGPPPRRQRGAARDHVDLPRARQLEDVIEPARAGRRVRAPRRAAPWRSASTSLPDARRRTPPTATGPRRSPSRATSSSSARSARRAPIYWPQTVLNTAVADSLKQPRRRARQAQAGRLRRADPDPVGHRQGPQAGPVRGQRLLRGVARRGRAPRAAEQPDHGRRAAGARRPTRRRSCSRSSASCPSASSRPAPTSTGSATSRSANIEASTALDIAKTMILPAAIPYLGRLQRGGVSIRSAIHLPRRSAGYTDELVDADPRARARAARGPRGGRRQRRGEASSSNDVIPAQNALREIADTLETVVADDLWPLPKYRELLFQY